MLSVFSWLVLSSVLSFVSSSVGGIVSSVGISSRFSKLNVSGSAFEDELRKYMLLE